VHTCQCTAWEPTVDCSIIYANLNSIPSGAPTLSVTGEDYESPTLYWSISNLCQLAGYKLYRGVNNPNNMQLIATFGASTLYYTDNMYTIEPEGEVTVYCKVKAFNWGVELPPIHKDYGRSQ